MGKIYIYTFQDVLLYYPEKFQKFLRSGMVFFTKFKNGPRSWRHFEFVILELFDIYFNKIPHFHMIFNVEFIREAICNFLGLQD